VAAAEQRPGQGLVQRLGPEPWAEAGSNRPWAGIGSVLPPRLAEGWDSQLERSKSSIKRFYREFWKNKVLQLKIPEVIITWERVHTALNALKPSDTVWQAAAAPPPLSHKQGLTKPQSFEIFNPTYDEIPHPTREIQEVDPPETDPLNPEKREVGCKTQHSKNVKQGPSTATGAPNLRSEQGELQRKTVQSLRCSTAAAPGRVWPHRMGQRTRHCRGQGPPRAAPAACHPFPPAGSLRLATGSKARPGTEAARREPSSWHSRPSLEKVCTVQLLR